MAVLSLSMIVKNEEKFLRDCLESIKNIVDEIVIVDTGSLDRTIDIAKEYTSNIFSFNWVNDFSAARNYSLSKCTGEWILYLDADERLEEKSLDETKKIIEQKENLAVRCLVKSIDDEYGRDNSMTFPRLFRNHPQLRFTGKVHEQIEASIKSLGYKLVDSGIEIIHLGYNISPENKRQKAKRNLDLLLADYSPDKTAYKAFQLAQTYNVLEDFGNAYNYSLIALDDKNLEKHHRANLLGLVALIELKEHKAQNAFRHISVALDIDGKQPFLNLLASKIFFRLGDLNAAQDYLVRSLKFNKELKTGNIKSSINILLDDEEIIYFGFIISIKSKNKTNFQFWIDKLRRTDQKKSHKSSEQICTFIEKLYLNTKLSEKEEKDLPACANDINIDVFLELLTTYRYLNSKIKMLKNLAIKFTGNFSVNNIYGITLADAGLVDEAIDVLSENITNNKENPGAVFYLLSLLLKKKNYEKIVSLLKYARENFFHIPEVNSRLQLLSEKLSSIIKK